MDPNGPTNYRLLAQILATYLTTHSKDPQKSATELGREWGASMVEPSVGPKLSRAATVGAVVDVLDDLGFRPEPPTSRATQIRIRHCPFQEVVKTHGSVICALHKGLMQGVLGTLNAPVTVTSLEPFVEPDLCVARLGAPDK
jgi:predicted ArsR family transcriptional regulator